MTSQPSLFERRSSPPADDLVVVRAEAGARELRLYDYQEAALEAVRERIRAGKKNIVLCAPTGAGKTLLSAFLMRASADKGKRSLFVVDRTVLIDQTSALLDDYGIDHGVVQADHWRRRPNELIQVASAQTLARREWPEGIDLVVVDEAHVQHRSTHIEIDKRARITIGLSVGPESIVELRGGVFGVGFVGRIEDAFSRAAEAGVGRDEWSGFERLDLAESAVETRGWSGRAFGWRPLKRMLRHVGDRECRALDVRGMDLLVTDDHSVFRVDAGEEIERRRGDRRPRVSPIFTAVPSVELAPRDLVATDDGAGWDSAIERTIDVIAEVKGMTGVQVMVDVTAVGSAVWRRYGISADQAYALRLVRRGIPISLYLEMRVCLPAPTGVRHEKSRAAWVAPVVRLSDWAYLLGFWLGDGWMTRGEIGRIAFAVERSIAPAFIDHLKTMPGVGWIPKVREMPGGAVEVRVSNIIVRMLLSRILGRVSAQTKTIPGEWIVSWPEVARRALLQGLLDSDGHRSVRSRNRRRAYYTTTSRALAASLLSLLRSLGVPGSLYASEPREGGTIAGRVITGRHTRYVVHWSSHAEARTTQGKYGPRTRYCHDLARFHEAPIRAIHHGAEAPAYVYDFEVDGGHPSFAANGVLVHNTATPFARGMGKHWDDIVTVRTTRALIREGWLSDFVVYAPSAPDMTGAKTVGGEWTDAEASSRAIPIVGDVVEQYLARAAGRKFLAFGADLAHLAAMERQFAQAGIRVALYTYRTPDASRAALVEEFRRRDSSLMGLASVGALARGFDVEHVSALIMARPLRRSLAEVIQQFGRGIRRDPEDPAKRTVCLDHASNMERHWTAINKFFDEGPPPLDDGRRRARSAAQRPSAVRHCPVCHAVHAPRPTCPECGYSYPRRERVHRAGDLRALTWDAKVEAGATADRQAFYSELLGVAAARGYKQGWAAHQYHARFGWWPDGLDRTPASPSEATERWVRHRFIRWAKSSRRAAPIEKP